MFLAFLQIFDSTLCAAAIACHNATMPVPRRKRTSGALTVSNVSSQIISVLDINFVFQKTKTLLYWGWTPLVLAIGLYTEPRPSWIDLINIWE